MARNAAADHPPAVFTVKRYYRPEWGDNWREHFTVDRVNGFLGHELKFDNQKLVSNYLRVGYDPDGSWRIYKLRPDFHPADKVQVEDDITASVVLPRDSLNDLDPEYPNPSVKLVMNCETLLFQRPDDAIHRGSDKQAEADIASPGTFLSNYEPFTVEQARAMVGSRRRVRQVHRADEAAAATTSSRERPTGVRGFVGASAHGGRQAVEESALSAEASRPGESARDATWRKSPRGWSARFPRTSRCISR